LKVEQYDGIYHSFKILKEVAYEVAMEQLSKSGNVTRKAMRDALTSNRTQGMVRVSQTGKPYWEHTKTPQQYGLRTPHNARGDLRGAESMANFITSFLMEDKGMLIVGGANPRFTPIKRENGKVVGRLKTQQAVSKRAVAILHRMDTGQENEDYDKRSQLYKNARPRGFMMKGIHNSQGKVREYLQAGYIRIVDKALNNTKVPIRKAV